MRYLYWFYPHIEVMEGDGNDKPREEKIKKMNDKQK